jgi:sterol desaturase/sphingolipid hydroxylase (fatty acid hydroxylase superfamily)
MGTRIEARRQELFESIPDFYSPWVHGIGTTGVCIAAIVIGAQKIRGPVHAYEWLILPLFLLLSNAVEWRAHKDILHRSRFLLEEIYRRHTPEHHTAFTYDRMEIESTQELKLVLLPVFGVALILLLAVPFAWLIGRFVSPNAGCFAVIASGSYVLAYELSHLSYHLPRESWVGRLSIVRRLREHHRRHHHPELMQSWNFNVTVPLFDWVHGTTVSDEEVQSVTTPEKR